MLYIWTLDTTTYFCDETLFPQIWPVFPSKKFHNLEHKSDFETSRSFQQNLTQADNFFRILIRKIKRPTKASCHKKLATHKTDKSSILFQSLFFEISFQLSRPLKTAIFVQCVRMYFYGYIQELAWKQSLGIFLAKELHDELNDWSDWRPQLPK